jgi:hypothetical protein
MKHFFYVLIFLVAWELYELLFRPDVKESVCNRVVDLLVGLLGAFLSSTPSAF